MLPELWNELHRRIDHQLQPRIVIRLKAHIVEFHRALFRVVQLLAACGGVRDVMRRPPFPEFGVACLQPRRRVDEGRVACS